MLQNFADTANGIGKLRRTSRLAISRKGDIHQVACLSGDMTEHEIAMQSFVEKARQLPLKDGQIDRRRSATGQIINLAIQARPIAGIIDVQVDSNRNPARPARNNGVDITQAGTVAAMIIGSQHDRIV